ncbi:MAG: FIST N-terminal domain-containing protein [Kiritimatiellia bacterium]
MKTFITGRILRHVAFALGLAGLFAGSPARAESTPALVCGTGGADLVKLEGLDVAALAQTAAERAKDRLGGVPAKAVIVHSFTPYPADKVLEGVARVFPKAITLGGPVYGVITEDGNVHSVGVMAVGGGVETTAVLATMDGGAIKAADTLAAGFHDALAAASSNGWTSAALLFGDCIQPRDGALLKQLAVKLGNDLPVAGGAGAGGVYFRGAVASNSVVAVLISGPFELGHALLGSSGARDAADLLRLSLGAANQAVGGATNRVDLAYVANCVSRRNALGKLLPDESVAFRAATGEAPVFGFYGNGEIGRNSPGEPSAGATHSIGVTVFRTKDELGETAPPGR